MITKSFFFFLRNDGGDSICLANKFKMNMKITSYSSLNLEEHRNQVLYLSLTTVLPMAWKRYQFTSNLPHTNYFLEEEDRSISLQRGT